MWDRSSSVAHFSDGEASALTMTVMRGVPSSTMVRGCPPTEALTNVARITIVNVGCIGFLL
jgi:hypothetical protein